jgi:DNA (cytosine-5)-methyltransferase 1
VAEVERPSSRPRLLDLFCCAGGAGMGYHRAGFEVVGVDIKHRARNPHPVIEADVLGLDPAWIADNFDAVHASPPCQFATELNNDKTRHENLIPPTRALLEATGLPYVIENVEGAKAHLVNPIVLCGSMFSLESGDAELRRHRLFECSFPVFPLPHCSHAKRRVIGVYGGHGRDRRRKFNGQDFTVEQRREAMGIDWMTGGELSQAIPPAYTEFLGRQLLAEVRARQALSEAA